MLKVLNNKFLLGHSEAEFETFAGKLGSDCAFFIENKPAFGTEKGNVLKKLLVNLSGNYIILVKPPVSVGTAEAYAGIHPNKPIASVNQLITLPLKQWKNQIVNDFEKNVFEKHPEIGTIKDSLYKQGAIYASMTGSGSAVYGIFEQEVNLKSSFDRMFYWGGWL